MSSKTRVSIDKKPAPRLPHERDESSDSHTSKPRAVIQQAHDDVQTGKQDTDRGPAMDKAYQQQKK